MARLYKAVMVGLGIGMVVINLHERGDFSLDGLGLAGIMLIILIGLISKDIDEHFNGGRKEL